ncbi:MAG: divergent PAP2 family protein [Firmicutes bacterium]|nr:divergent PAP2 family protein [Bacillota bacterium]
MFFDNKIFWVSLAGWTVAQLLKVFFDLLTHRKLNLSRLVGAGGMPSSHAAFVSALTTAVGIVEGWDSTAFAIALVLALIVMYDAAGVRRAVGKQARILNTLIPRLYHGSNLVNEKEKLKELLGHSPFEVFSGAVLGGLIAYLLT